jgi:hypothetical protein
MPAGGELAIVSVERGLHGLGEGVVAGVVRDVVVAEFPDAVGQAVHLVAGDGEGEVVGMDGRLPPV